jgi:putative membrane protein
VRLAHSEAGGLVGEPLQVVTVLVLVLAAWLYLEGAVATRTVLRPRTLSYLAGLAVVAVALVSPVDTFADDLLVVHVAQHVLLVLLAAPLLVLARPLPVLLRGLPRPLGRALLRTGGGRALRLGRATWLAPLAAVAHVVVLWGGHVPVVYDAALRLPVVHAAEHVLLLATGGLLWWAVLDPAGRSLAGSGGRLAAVALSAAAGIVLGVALLSSPQSWYDGHEEAWRWGIAPLDDQRAAGALMWAAGGPGYALAGAAVVIRLLGGRARDEEVMTNPAERFESEPQ